MTCLLQMVRLSSYLTTIVVPSRCIRRISPASGLWPSHPWSLSASHAANSGTRRSSTRLYQRPRAASCCILRWDFRLIFFIYPFLRSFLGFSPRCAGGTNSPCRAGHCRRSPGRRNPSCMPRSHLCRGTASPISRKYSAGRTGRRDN